MKTKDLIIDVLAILALAGIIYVVLMIPVYADSECHDTCTAFHEACKRQWCFTGFQAVFTPEFWLFLNSECKNCEQQKEDCRKSCVGKREPNSPMEP